MDYVAETYVYHEVFEMEENQGNEFILRLRRVPRWKEPKFSPKVWSVYERVLNDEPRTTNMLEGWHRRFGTVVTKHHPNIFDFTGCLRAEQARTEGVVSKLIMGESPKNIRKGQRKQNKRIKKVVEAFNTRDG